MKFHLKILTSLFFISLTQMMQAQLVYVNAIATGANNGTSWQDAYTDLQTAVDETLSGQIWVAEGIYKPDEVLERYAAFRLKPNVDLKGGFPNTGNPKQDDCDWELYPTILSGDLGIQNDTSDNAYKILSLSSSDPFDNTIYGFIFTDGNSSYEGGAVDVNGRLGIESNLIIKNCIFRDNFAKYGGAAIGVSSTEVGIFDCTFENNHAGYEGATITSHNAELTVVDCIFENNFAGYQGGAISVSKTILGVNGCVFENNYAEHEGGAISYFGDTLLMDDEISGIVNSIFQNNYTDYQGGAIDTRGDINLANCLFEGNFARREGGAWSHFFNGDLNALNCTFVNNETERGGAVLEMSSRAPSIAEFTNCLFWNNGGNSTFIGNPDSEIRLKYALVEESECPPGVICGDGLIYGQNPDFAGVNDFHLSANSPCINAGDDGALLGLTVDLDKNDRVVGSKVDLGVYEYQNTVSVEDQKNDNNFSVFPIPVGEILTIKTENNLPEKSRISLFDFSGKELFFESTFLVAGTNHEVDVSALSSGIFLLKVTSGNSVFIKKIIK